MSKIVVWFFGALLLFAPLFLVAEDAPRKGDTTKERVGISVVRESDDEIVVTAVGHGLGLGDPMEELFTLNIQRSVGIVEVTLAQAKRVTIATDAMAAAELSAGGKEFTAYFKAGRWKLQSGDPPKKKEDVKGNGLVLLENKNLTYHEGATLKDRKVPRVWKQIPEKKKEKK